MLRWIPTLAVALSAAALSAVPASGQTAEEVVARSLSAKGGVDRLKAISTARIAGRITSPEGNEARMTTLSKRPNKLRQEIVTKAGGMTLISGFDGTTAWGFNPASGQPPQQISGPQADMAREDAEFDSVFIDYKQKGHTIELVGTEEIDGRPMHHVKLTKKNGRVQHHYFDAKDGLERRIVVTIEQGPIKGEMRTELSDYRDVDGINVPFAMRRTVNGKPGPRVDLDKVEFNVPIDDASFEPPQK